jgi:hypothetical protein
MVRPKHPNKELEKLIRDLEEADWKVTKGRKYYRAKCPCGGHQASIKLTPSNPNWTQEKRRHLERDTCWKGAS